MYKVQFQQKGIDNEKSQRVQRRYIELVALVMITRWPNSYAANSVSLYLDRISYQCQSVFASDTIVPSIFPRYGSLAPYCKDTLIGKASGKFSGKTYVPYTSLSSKHDANQNHNVFSAHLRCAFVALICASDRINKYYSLNLNKTYDKLQRKKKTNRTS